MAKGGMGNLMKQAQMMQANMQRAQAELAAIEIEGQASNGLIKIKMTCKNEIKKIEIDPSLLTD
ncbi:MAG: YbaB/EbfC family nucleoid-associated protein, partial [Proteobacteria bacterium]|nr:YbaB/EbfC family nucleoid-associated protein [Pseudomonadota bacterium]